jgi:hypothetical protein
MTYTDYPLHLRQRSEQRWSARLATAPARRSPSRGADSCSCGHLVIAPSNSTCVPATVINYWQCCSCGNNWESSAEVNVAPADRPLAVSHLPREYETTDATHARPSEQKETYDGHH